LFFKLKNNQILFILELEEKDEAKLKTAEDTTSIGSNSVRYNSFIFLFDYYYYYLI
jgi:hypothetical protein